MSKLKLQERIIFKTQQIHETEIKLEVLTEERIELVDKANNKIKDIFASLKISEVLACIRESLDELNVNAMTDEEAIEVALMRQIQDLVTDEQLETKQLIEEFILEGITPSVIKERLESHHILSIFLPLFKIHAIDTIDRTDMDTDLKKSSIELYMIESKIKDHFFKA